MPTESVYDRLVGVDLSKLPTDELREAMVALNDEVRTIEAQLSSRNRLDPEGQRLEGPAYWGWRDRAKAAWRYRARRYSELR